MKAMNIDEVAIPKFEVCIKKYYDQQSVVRIIYRIKHID